MVSIRNCIGFIGLGISLTACAATIPPVEVTRFHNAVDAPLARGSVAMEVAAENIGDKPMEDRIYEAAVMRELQRVGFTDAGSSADTSEFVVRVSVVRSRLDAGGSRSPVSVGVGGSTGSYGSGIGLGIGINLGGGPKPKIITDLSVRIAQRSDDKVIWEGRSSVQAKQGSPAAQSGLAAAKLAEALFRDFPGQSGATISVP